MSDWIISHDGTQGELAYAMECKRCGDIQKVAVPINLDVYLAMAAKYMQLHATCKERIEKNGGTT